MISVDTMVPAPICCTTFVKPVWVKISTAMDPKARLNAWILVHITMAMKVGDGFLFIWNKNKLHTPSKKQLIGTVE